MTIHFHSGHGVIPYRHTVAAGIFLLQGPVCYTVGWGGAGWQCGSYLVTIGCHSGSVWAVW